jgi:hypothetical protein
LNVGENKVGRIGLLRQQLESIQPMFFLLLENLND